MLELNWIAGHWADVEELVSKAENLTDLAPRTLVEGKQDFFLSRNQI